MSENDHCLVVHVRLWLRDARFRPKAKAFFLSRTDKLSAQKWTGYVVTLSRSCEIDGSKIGEASDFPFSSLTLRKVSDESIALVGHVIQIFAA